MEQHKILSHPPGNVLSILIIYALIFAKMKSMINIRTFKSIDTDPGGILKRLKDYVEEMNLLFQMVFRKSDGTAFMPTDAEKKGNAIAKRKA